MKPLLSVLVAAAVLASATGCAKSDASGKPRRSASRIHRARATAAASTTVTSGSSPASAPGTPATPPHPADAGASNAALGPSARDALGHPAIDAY